MKKILSIILVITAVLSGMSPCQAQDGGGFAIAPASLEVSVSDDEAGRVNIYVTSQFDGNLVVGTEGIPFEVEPVSIPVNAGDRGRKVALTVYGDPSLESGEYPGKLTFLAYTGGNIAYGIKVNIVVKQTDNRGIVAEFIDRFEADGDGETGLNYTIIILAGICVIAALFIGLVIGRRWRRPETSPSRENNKHTGEDE